MHTELDDVSGLIHAARLEQPGAVERLLAAYRDYLVLFARLWLHRAMASKADPSDLVQEALLRAQQRFRDFHGSNETELVLWLRRILARIAADLGRRYRTGARHLSRERSLEELWDTSAHELAAVVATGTPTPSQAAQRRELGVVLADALASLSKEHREVIVLRNLEELDWATVARQMKRSVGAAQMLWARALKELRPYIEARL